MAKTLAAAPEKLSSADVLRPRQLRFALAYLRSGNGVAAAREAGYAGDGDSLAVTASRLLRNPQVRALVDKPKQAAGSLVDRLRAELEQIALGTPEDNLTYQSKLRGAELLSRILGLTRDDSVSQQHITVNQLVLDVRSMDETQLLAQLQRIQAQKDKATAKSPLSEGHKPIVDIPAQDAPPPQEGA